MKFCALDIGNIFPIGLILLNLLACQNGGEDHTMYSIKINDPNLKLELIAQQPEIVTPIGLIIDSKDQIYVMESHTHTPPQDYQGRAFDRILKGADEDADGAVDEWVVYADSIEDGMNITADVRDDIYLCTKNKVIKFSDSNGNGKSDKQKLLLQMTGSADVYDHAGILGITIGPDDWLYVSRGNCGSMSWKITGSDGSTLQGYGDGGNVFRCKIDGSQLEEIATGFWNPFGIQFNHQGYLLVTDNDPDSRGPNRLIEIVPGGDYGYQSLYGGSGIHPYLAWNGELPGTLPYAAALGEAPCALIDASYSNFGESYQNAILVNVWEENNIVRIPIQSSGSSIRGEAQILIQGNNDFHPVAMAFDSKGNLYITDWVIREYPNHLNGKIWRLSGRETRSKISTALTKRFEETAIDIGILKEQLVSDDPFQNSIARHHLSAPEYRTQILAFLQSSEVKLRVQSVLIYTQNGRRIPNDRLVALLNDPDIAVRKMSLINIGKTHNTEMINWLAQRLIQGKIDPQLFETCLATLCLLQPEFIDQFTGQTAQYANRIPRKLPPDFIASMVFNESTHPTIRSIALPFLDGLKEYEDQLISMLKITKNDELKFALIKALQNSSSPEFVTRLAEIALDPENKSLLRAKAIASIRQTDCIQLLPILDENDPLLRKLILKRICHCKDDMQAVNKIEAMLNNSQDNVLEAIWQYCLDPTIIRNMENEQWEMAGAGNGDWQYGKILFEMPITQCITCHKVNHWGGDYGPDLTNIASSKSKAQLINAILKPNLEIAPEWQGWYIIDSSGTQQIGRQIDVHLNRAELMNQNGNFISYPHIRDFGVLDISLMPQGLHKTITPEEFNDLITYLLRLK